MAKDSNELLLRMAENYFKIGNAVVAFYVVQTLIFLNAVYRFDDLLKSLRQYGLFYAFFVVVIAAIYIFIIHRCWSLEKRIYHAFSQDIQFDTILLVNRKAFLERRRIIIFLGALCLVLFVII